MKGKRREAIRHRRDERRYGTKKKEKLPPMSTQRGSSEGRPPGHRKRYKATQDQEDREISANEERNQDDIER